MTSENQWCVRASKDNAIAVASRAPLSVSRNVATLLSASFSAAKTQLLQVYEADDNSVAVKGTLAIDAVPEKFKTTTAAYYVIAGVGYAKAITTAIVFTAAHVINANKFGIILVQINAAGTISTKVPLTPQVYADAATALAAKPAPDAGNVELGYIAIAAGAANWTANTDDMTNGSDVTTAAFTDATETGELKWEDYVVNSIVLPFRRGAGSHKPAKALLAVLAASGTGGTIGKVNLSGYSR